MLVAVLTITAAVLLTLARVLLPFANNYTSPLQDWLSEELGQPVIIKSFSAEWQGLGPLFNLDDLSFLDANSGGIRVAIKQARIAIDVPASILNAELRFGNLTISEIDLSLIKRRDGSVSVAGMSGANDGSGVDKDAGVNMLSWLFSQDRLALERSTIH